MKYCLKRCQKAFPPKILSQFAQFKEYIVKINIAVTPIKTLYRTRLRMYSVYQNDLKICSY